MVLIAGAIAGACVCVFGMWAFLKGQGVMLDLGRGAKPSLFTMPAALAKKNGRDTLPEQMRALFREPDAKRGG